jgi:hypothetical protein
MLGFNQTNTELLLQESGEISFLEYDIQAYLRGLKPHLQKIIFLTTCNARTSALLTKYVNALLDEAMCDPDVFDKDLARTLSTRVCQAINLAIHGAGVMKETAFLKVILSALSRINTVDDKVMVPNSVLNQLKELDQLDQQ